MDNQKNVLMMDFASNADLKSLVSGWSVGESYELRLKLQLNEMNNDGAKFTVQEVAYEEPSAEEPNEIEPDQSSPVMMVMGPGQPNEPVVAP